MIYLHILTTLLSFRILFMKEINMTNKQQETITTSNELLTREPFPASTKVYIEGKIHTDIKVPVREILLANETKLRVYDTSGP